MIITNYSKIHLKIIIYLFNIYFLAFFKKIFVTAPIYIKNHQNNLPGCPESV